MMNSRNSGANSLIIDDLQHLVNRINISHQDNAVDLNEDSNLKTDTNIETSVDPIKSGNINKSKIQNDCDLLRAEPGKDNDIQINEKLYGNDDVLAEWEKHGKGIATKLLIKTGFQPGKGLGKHLQGMVSPIEATPRRGRGALGFYESNNSSKEKMQKTTNNSEKKFVRTMNNMTHGNNDQGIDLKMKHNPNNQPYKNVKPPYTTKTYMMENPGALNHLSRDSIIKSPYATLNNQQNQKSDQNQIKNSAKKILKNQNYSTNCHNPLNELESQFMNMKVNENSDSEKKLDTVTKSLEDCMQECQDIPLVDVLEECSDLLETLQWSSNERDINKKIKTEVTKIITQAVRKEFMYWNPIKEGNEGLRLMAFTRQVLLLVPHPPEEKNIMQFRFDAILHNIIIPKIRITILSWNVKHPEEILNFLELWSPILSPDMISDIVENHVYFRLEKYLKKWDPINDSMSPESWLRPWLKDLKTKRHALYPIIFRKLEEALMDAEADEFNPEMMMKAGLAILDEKHVQIFVLDHVVPRLIKHLKNIQFDIKIQNFTKLKQVTDWSEYAPQKIIANMLADNFFPKLIQTVASYVAFSKVEMSELCMWLAQWLNQIPRPLKSNVRIKDLINSIIVLVKLGINTSKKKIDT